MGYEVRLGDILFPVSPSKMDIDINGNNKTINLINDGEINIIKKVSLVEVSFEVLLPNVQHPFAIYENDKFKDSAYFLDLLKNMMLGLKPYKFTILRTMPNGVVLFDTDLLMAIEDFSIKEDSGNGLDIVVALKLKEYKEYKTKYYDENAILIKRKDTNSLKPKTKPILYKAKNGDTLWGIAKVHYGDGSLYSKLVKENGITNPNKISVGQVIKIPV